MKEGDPHLVFLDGINRRGKVQRRVVYILHGGLVHRVNSAGASMGGKGLALTPGRTTRL